MKAWKARQLVFLAGLAAAIAMASGCTDEKTIFVERVLFQDPPEAAQGFLGYDEADTKLTTCGNCHVGQQAKWQTAAHAHAWETLQASGHASAACENCHTVGPNGNATSGNVGYAGAKDERYHDVQCESCHGPGLDHVTNPDARPRPVPSLKIFSVSAGDTTLYNCAECHQGTHHPFVEEWLQSKHATPVASPAGRAECVSCHTAQGALAAWGVQADYQEKDAALGADTQLGIVCATCHDPHGSPNTAQLRFPIDVPDENTHLCMKCHHKRAEPEVDSATIRGPHSPEGPLLLGEAGWWPPGFSQQQIITTHGSPSANPKLCVTCHVSSFTVTDQSTGAFSFQATGHLFQAIPCIGPDGKPQVGDNCDVEDRSFLGCLGSGCHASEDVARNAYNASKTVVEDYVSELDRLLALPAVAADIKGDGIFTVAEGAQFNKELGELPGSSTHNPFLVRQLLQASIKAVKDAYGVTVSSGIVLDPEFQ